MICASFIADMRFSGRAVEAADGASTLGAGGLVSTLG